MGRQRAMPFHLFLFARGVHKCRRRGRRAPFYFIGHECHSDVWRSKNWCPQKWQPNTKCFLTNSFSPNLRAALSESFARVHTRIRVGDDTSNGRAMMLIRDKVKHRRPRMCENLLKRDKKSAAQWWWIRNSQFLCIFPHISSLSLFRFHRICNRKLKLIEWFTIGSMGRAGSCWARWHRKRMPLCCSADWMKWIIAGTIWSRRALRLGEFIVIRSLSHQTRNKSCLTLFASRIRWKTVASRCALRDRNCIIYCNACSVN